MHDTSSNTADSCTSHGQPESQPEIHTSKNLDFYKSHDYRNMITRNLEQLIIPQSSIPQRTTQEGGHNTERPASIANSHQNHCSHCGQPGHQKSQGYHIICPYLL